MINKIKRKVNEIVDPIDKKLIRFYELMASMALGLAIFKITGIASVNWLVVSLPILLPTAAIATTFGTCVVVLKSSDLYNRIDKNIDDRKKAKGKKYKYNYEKYYTTELSNSNEIDKDISLNNKILEEVNIIDKEAAKPTIDVQISKLVKLREELISTVQTNNHTKQL